MATMSSEAMKTLKAAIRAFAWIRLDRRTAMLKNSKWIIMK